MNMARSSTGDAESSEGFKFFGSENSEKRSTPGCVHGWRSPPGPPTVPVFVQPLRTSTAPRTAGATAANALFTSGSFLAVLGEHGFRLDAVTPAEIAVRVGRDLRRLDFAASAPKHVRIGKVDAGLAHVLVDGGLVGEHGCLLGAVHDRHDIHPVKLRSAFAPIRMGHDVVPGDFAAGV